MTQDINIHLEENHESASIYVVNQIKDLIEKSEGKFSLGLSGGETPRFAYSMMSETFENLSQTTIWTVDDRWVEAKDELSNQNLINTYFEQTQAEILKFNYTGNSPQLDAEMYEKKIEETIDSFNVAILGLGQDGHIASLFPNSTAIINKESLYVANEVNIKTKWRVTATFGLLGKIDKIFILATGENKNDILKSVNTASNLPINTLKKFSNNIEIVTDQII